jgi:NSS family neurotransmitter:Na+ symporter
LGTAFSFNSWSDVKFFDRSIFQLLDYLTANLMLPIGGFCIAIFAGWIMKRQHSEEELNMPNVESYQVWKILISYVAPSAVFFVFLHVIGVL